MSRRSSTLRNTLLRWLLIPLLLLFLIDAAGTYVIANRLSERVYDGELAEIARELGLHVTRDGQSLRFDLEPDAQRALLLDRHDKVIFALRSPAGELIAGDAALTLPVTDSSTRIAFHDSDLNGIPVRIATLRTGFGAEAFVPPAVVQVAQTRVKRRALAQEIMLDVILPQLLLICIASLLVWIGVARGLSPLQRLRAAIAARSHLDLSPVSSDDVPGEVHPLLQAINDLMARLNDVLTVQNRFVADAAHQLRTPVAGLKTHIELALREDDPEENRRSLTHLYTSVDRMSRLVSQLLSLARYEAKSVRMRTFLPVDLRSLAMHVTTAWVPEAYKKHIDLGFEGAADAVKIEGDSVGLTELLNNLLDNAIRYTPERGRITVRLDAFPVPTLSVSDDGRSIPKTDRERVFERFYRLLGNNSDGSGLGLAIVREIAGLHGADVTLSDDGDGKGNKFTITFNRKLST